MRRTDLGLRTDSSVGHRRPARTLCALLLSAVVLGAVVASPAVAQAPLDPPFDQILINGNPAQRCGTDQFPFTRYCNAGGAVVTDATSNALLFANDSQAGADREPPKLLEVDLSLSAASQNAFISGHVNRNQGPCGQLNGRLLCRLREPGRAGDDPGWELLYKAQRPVTDGLVVNFSFSQCAGEKRDAPTAFGPPLAARADRCKPPSGTTIRRAKVNGNEAVFTFAARHATGFTCDLFANGALVVRHSCRSPQSVGPLPPGQYLFTVAGVNDAGFDKPDKKRFAIR